MHQDAKPSVHRRTVRLSRPRPVSGANYPPPPPPGRRENISSSTSFLLFLYLLSVLVGLRWVFSFVDGHWSSGLRFVFGTRVGVKVLACARVRVRVWWAFISVQFVQFNSKAEG